MKHSTSAAAMSRVIKIDAEEDSKLLHLFKCKYMDLYGPYILSKRISSRITIDQTRDIYVEVYRYTFYAAKTCIVCNKIISIVLDELDIEITSYAEYHKDYTEDFVDIRYL